MTLCETQEIFQRMFDKLNIAIFYYMSTFIHHCEKMSSVWVQQVEIQWLVLPQNASFKNDYFGRQSY